MSIKNRYYTINKQLFYIILDLMQLNHNKSSIKILLQAEKILKEIDMFNISC